MGIPAQLQREQIEPVYIGAKRYLGRDSAIRPGVAKNAADIQLALDALEIVHDKPNIENYILISGDYDFVPLVMKLHKHSKRVCLAGIQASTSRDLRDLVGDDFVTIDELLGIQALDVPKIDTVDWYALVKLLVGWESGSMEFVGKKLFARQLPPSIVGKYDTPEGRPMIVGEAIAAGIIEVYYVPNPKSPGTSTAAIRVNREHIFVKKVLSGGQ